MRLTHILLVALVAIVATTLGAPVLDSEQQDAPEQTTVSVVDQSDDAADATEVAEEVTTVLPVSDDAEEGSARDGRQIDEGDDEEDGDQDDEDDDDEDEEANEEEEEEEDRKRAGTKPVKAVSSKKKTPAPAKPVPHLDQGVEDDEAEDLGIFERDEPKSSDETVAKGSDEADDEENENEDDDEEGSDEDADDDDDGDEPARSTGLIAEPVSSERGDVDDVIPQAPVTPAKSDNVQPEQPLAIAVVQPEETADPVVPILVEETVPSSSNVAETKEEKKNKKAGKPEPQADDDDEDDDDEEDEEEDDDEARSEKIHRARSAYPPSPVLYYYPFPDAPIVPATEY